MKQEEPTQEQIKEFWEWCGFTHFIVEDIPWHKKPEDYQRIYWYANNHWIYPNGSKQKDPPPIDLNSLFKYAVPKAIDKIMLPQEQGCSCEIAYAIIFKKWLQYLELDIPNHVTTLFWVIWGVIKK